MTLKGRAGSFYRKKKANSASMKRHLNSYIELVLHSHPQKQHSPLITVDLA